MCTQIIIFVIIGTVRIIVLLQSFKYHTQVEHFMLAYVFFYVNVQDLPNEDLSHLEMYIDTMVSAFTFIF